MQSSVCISIILPEPADKYGMSDLHSDLQKPNRSPLRQDAYPEANTTDTSSQDGGSQQEYNDSAQGKGTEKLLRVRIRSEGLLCSKPLSFRKAISVSTEMQTNRVSQGYAVRCAKTLE